MTSWNAKRASSTGAISISFCSLSLVLSLRGMEILSLESTTRKRTTFSFSRCWLLPMGRGRTNCCSCLWPRPSRALRQKEFVVVIGLEIKGRKRHLFLLFFFEHFFGSSLSYLLFLLHLFLFSTSFVHIRAGQVGRRDKHNS